MEKEDNDVLEKEDNGVLPFLSVLVSREEIRLGHNVYRKQTHTDIKNSNHHPSQKRGIIKTDRMWTICQTKYMSRN